MTRSPALSLQRQRGFNLVELMIAMVIGLFLVGGALTIFVQGNAAQRTSTGLSRLQENGRFVMDMMVPDIRGAGLWGLTYHSDLVDKRFGSTNAFGALTGDCRVGSYIDLDKRLEASDDANSFTACIPAADYLDGTDVLVVRRASVDVVTAYTAGRMYIRSDRTHGEIFQGAAVPSNPFAVDAEDHALIVHVYYIRPYSYSATDGIPMLRRKVLSAASGGATIADEEVAPGVEDLQVQFGVDADADGDVDSYVDATSAAFDIAEVRAVRFWLLLRAEEAERDYTDAATYEYGTTMVTPADAYRRLLVSSTVLLRNTMIVEE